MDPNQPVGIEQSSTGLPLITTHDVLYWYNYSAFYGISNTKICLHDLTWCSRRPWVTHIWSWENIQVISRKDFDSIFNYSERYLYIPLLLALDAAFFVDAINLCNNILYVSWFRKAWEKWKTWFTSSSREEFIHFFKHTERYVRTYIIYMCMNRVFSSDISSHAWMISFVYLGAEKRGKDESHGYPIAPSLQDGLLWEWTGRMNCVMLTSSIAFAIGT